MYTYYCFLFSRMFIFCIEGKITDVNFLQSIFNFKCDRLIKNIPFLMFHFYGNI